MTKLSHVQEYYHGLMTYLFDQWGDNPVVGWDAFYLHSDNLRGLIIELPYVDMDLSRLGSHLCSVSDRGNSNGWIQDINNARAEKSNIWASGGVGPRTFWKVTLPDNLTSLKEGEIYTPVDPEPYYEVLEEQASKLCQAMDLLKRKAQVMSFFKEFDAPGKGIALAFLDALKLRVKDGEVILALY
jgi:hypothetical protein